MNLTDEQVAYVDLYRQGTDIVVEAGAGTGKSSTLKAGAHADPRRAAYIAYNRSTADDARKSMPWHVEANTAHGFASRAVGRRFMGRRNASARQPAKVTAEILARLNRPAFEIGLDAGLHRAGLARLSMRTLAAWCKSADREVLAQHVPDTPQLRPDERRGAVAAAVMLAATAWQDLQHDDNSGKGELPFEHDHYLKMWALTNPRLPVDVVMFDEAQDANPVMAGVVEGQTHAQRVAVGDRCQPAGTLVAVVRGAATRAHRAVIEQVPIEQVRTGDRVVSYDVSKAFLRRGGSTVEGVTARPFEGALIRATTADGHSSAYTPDHHCIAHIAPALTGRHVLYLMRRGGDYRIGISTGIRESQGNRPGFIIRAMVEGADAAWVLDTFADRGDAAAAETIASLEHRIPQLTFRVGNRSVMTQDRLDALWSKVGGNRQAAADLLAQYGRSIDFPLWQSGDDRLLVRRAAVVRACNLLDGMTVLTRDGAMDANGKRAHRNLWSPITVSREPYVGPVYSMTVERDHTYVGDGIVTHNCQAINGWNGAVDAMSGWPWHRLTLSQSFRFGPAVADVANLWLDALDGPIRLRGYDALDTRVGYCPEPTLILCRGNVAAIVAADREANDGRRVAMAGGAGEVQRLAFAARDLQAGRPTDHPQLYLFSDWDALREYAEDEGSGLNTFVKLIDRFGTGWVLRVCADLVRESENPDVVVSTVHKAKGRESANVLISGDFPEPGDVDAKGKPVPFTREDGMLAYVAVTRARELLDLGGLAWIQHTTPVFTDGTDDTEAAA